MDRILQLAEAVWDAWTVPAVGDEPVAHRQAELGEHGLLSFRVDDEAEEPGYLQASSGRE